MNTDETPQQRGDTPQKRAISEEAKLLGQRIFDLRGRRSQTDLAKAAGIDPATLNRIERAKRRAKESTLTSIARALGVDPAVLLNPAAPIQGVAGKEEPLREELHALLAAQQAEIRDLWSVARDARRVADDAMAANRALAAQVARLSQRRGRRSA